jgi:hypothetical protein
VRCDEHGHSETLWFGCDGNVDVSTLFEPHIITMFVR